MEATARPARVRANRRRSVTSAHAILVEASERTHGAERTRALTGTRAKRATTTTTAAARGAGLAGGGGTSSRGAWNRPRCAAFGARSTAPPVHLVCGVVTGEAPCTGAVEVLAEHIGKAPWRAISLAGCAALLDDVEGFAIGTYDALAVLTDA